MQRTKPPFRADQVGSLLRPAALREARAKRQRGEISMDALRAVEDREIVEVVRKQEEIGLKSVTDGEFRRRNWNNDFLGALENVECYEGERSVKFSASGPQPRQELLRVVGKLGGYAPHPMVEHFSFLKSHARQTPKVTIPSPSSLHFRYGRAGIPDSIYPDIDEFYHDLGESYRKVTAAFVAAGCRYLQFDEVNLTKLCDPSLRRFIIDRGEDPAALPAAYAGMINAAIADIPDDMVVTMHLCRGNFRSNFVASGGYEPVADAMFNAFNIHGYFMEYDTERAGGFEPLRFLPKGGKQVVLGLVTSKAGLLESRDDIRRRVDEATKYISLDQLCLSPQCGFASTEEGNLIDDEEQWAKLRMIVDLAEEIWR